MLPVLELRGAIPLGVSLGLPHLISMLVSVLGNLVPVPFIIVFIRRIFAWMRTRSPRFQRIVERMEKKAYSNKEVLYKWEILGLIILVAIPLPGTGAWTGALVAAFFDIRLKTAFPAIFLGVVIAGILVSGITFGFTELF
jgi:uncharacterized membrane protein